MTTNKIFDIQNEIIHFGLDHLEIYWTFKKESEYFDLLDFDNSNYCEFEDYTITKNEVPRYKYKIIFTSNDCTPFAYYKWRPKWEGSQNVDSKDYIVIYSTAFKLMEYEEICYFLEVNFDLLHCRRFDICIDLKTDINTILNYFGEYKTWREFKKSWETETRYIWEVRNYLNKRQIIRIYNKKKDLLIKRKTKLYEDYLDIDNVTRIELEVRQELARTKYYKNLFDNTLLIWIFKNYLYKHTKIFECIDWDKVKLPCRKKTILNDELLQDYYYKNYRKIILLWHARTIYKMWFCPVRILIWENLIQNNTKKFIWEEIINRLYNLEKSLKDKSVLIKDKKLSSNQNNYD
jgi:hypothetical protein